MTTPSPRPTHTAEPEAPSLLDALRACLPFLIDHSGPSLEKARAYADAVAAIKRAEEEATRSP